jgi:hypothetical protein
MILLPAELLEVCLVLLVSNAEFLEFAKDHVVAQHEIVHHINSSRFQRLFINLIETDKLIFNNLNFVDLAVT